jgi:hypothetical protein
MYRLIAVYADHGMLDQALDEEERWRPLIAPPIYWSALAYIYGRTGRTAEARHAIQELLRVSAWEPVQARVFAWSYAGVGDREQTLAWLEKGVRGALGRAGGAEGHSPAYDFLREDPRFKRVLERVGLGR